MRTARQMGLVACQRCLRVWPAGQSRCGRCGHGLRSRDPMSLQKVWALWLVGLICYVPANLYPMLRTRTLAEYHASTIVEGALEIGRSGDWPIALIILAASVAIPVTKFIVIAALALSIGNRTRLTAHRRQQLHEIVEYIGRWSMIDVFVVAILSSLVHLGSIVSFAPGVAALFFALSVIFTMISAQAFDSRLIWDAQAEVPLRGDDTLPVVEPAPAPPAPTHSGPPASGNGPIDARRDATGDTASRGTPPPSLPESDPT